MDEGPIVWVLLCNCSQGNIRGCYPMVKRLYKIRKNEKLTITTAKRAKPRLKLGAMESFFIIRTSAKQAEMITKVRTELLSSIWNYTP